MQQSKPLPTSLIMGLHMLLLLHALIPCLAAYILPSSPVWLHIYCPHPLSCCIYTALVSLLLGTVIPTSFNILMAIYLLPYYLRLEVVRESYECLAQLIGCGEAITGHQYFCYESLLWLHADHTPNFVATEFGWLVRRQNEATGEEWACCDCVSHVVQ